jgi:hypothetical protein
VPFVKKTASNWLMSRAGWNSTPLLLLNLGNMFVSFRTLRVGRRTNLSA